MNNRSAVYVKSTNHFGMSSIGLTAPSFIIGKQWSWLGMMNIVGDSELGGTASYLTRNNSSIGITDRIMSINGSTATVGLVGDNE